MAVVTQRILQTRVGGRKRFLLRNGTSSRTKKVAALRQQPVSCTTVAGLGTAASVSRRSAADYRSYGESVDTRNDTRTSMNTVLASLTREQLYDLVWREPMLKVAGRLGVSSSYMARVCTELRVPRPERGYWAKLEFGKETQRPALPPAMPGDITEWKPGVAVGSTQRVAARRGNVRSSAQGGPSATLDRRHELLEGVKPLFLKTRDTETGLLRPFKRLLVDIVVSEKHLDATLDAADSLFRALAAKGHRVMLASPNERMRRAELDEREVQKKGHYHRAVWSPDRATVVYVGGVPIGLTLFEMTESVEMMYVGSSKYVPVRDLSPEQLRRFKGPHYWRTTKDFASGRLALQAYSTSWMVAWTQRWQETKAEQFASLVPQVVKVLEATAPELVRRQEEAQQHADEERRKWEEERRRAQEQAERARQLKARQDARQDLLAAIASWEEARSIHSFFEVVERELRSRPQSEQQELDGRLREARALIGEVDALTELRRWRAPQER